MRLGFNDLRSRMTLMFVGLLLLVQVATLSLTNFMGARLAGEQFLPVLERAEASLGEELAQRQRALAPIAGATARVASLRRAAGGGDWDAASGLLREQARRQRVDLAMYLDGTGRVRAASETLALAPSDTKFEIPDVARKGRPWPVQFVFDGGGRLLLLAVVPIEPGAGSASGFVAVGRAVDESLVRRFGDAGRVEASLMIRRPQQQWKLAATSILAARAGDVERTLSRELGPVGMLASISPFDLREFQNRVVELPVTGGSAAVVLQQALGSALAPFESLRLVVSVVTGLSMLVFVLGSGFIASSITRPVRELAGAARRIRAGDYSQPIRTRAHGEITELASSLDSMREEVARREADVHRLAYYDSLTGLANRAMFRLALRDAVAAATNSGDDLARGRLVVFLLDLDRFKWVNDTLGHECGDRVLEAAAERLRAALCDGEVVSRLGGDEFAVLATGANRPAHELVDRISAALEPPIAIAQHSVDIGASIGIAHFPEHGRTAEELLRHADAAMYTAKRHGVPSAVFDPALETTRVRHLSMLSDLRAALERQELELYVQPKIALEEGATRLSGEVLVRWQHPERGMLPPSDFIPFAEQTGFIRQMTIYLLPRAITQAAAWLREGIEVTLAVNVSARDLEERGFAQRVARWLASESLPSRLLCLEVTETALMEEPERAVAVLRDLRNIGVQLAIDDYGTGLSSLAYLKTLWVNELKIDQAFVAAMQDNERDATIVRSTIELGHSLGLKVTAEGVETGRQAEMLRGFGCDSAQGHFFAMPLPVADFDRWIREQRKQTTPRRIASAH